MCRARLIFWYLPPPMPMCDIINMIVMLCLLKSSYDSRQRWHIAKLLSSEVMKNHTKSHFTCHIYMKKIRDISSFICNYFNWGLLQDLTFGLWIKNSGIWSHCRFHYIYNSYINSILYRFYILVYLYTLVFTTYLFPEFAKNGNIKCQTFLLRHIFIALCWCQNYWKFCLHWLINTALLVWGQ